MIRAVLDTNVFISNLLRPGPSRAILSRAGTAFQLIVSSSITMEVGDVLQRPRIVRKLSLTDAERRAYVDSLTLSSALVVPGLVQVDEFPADPKDTHLLACALEGAADYLVTGDAALLNLVTFHGTKIVAPRAFLDVLESAGGQGQPPAAE